MSRRAFLFLGLLLGLLGAIDACSIFTDLSGYSGGERVVYVTNEAGSDGASPSLPPDASADAEAGVDAAVVGAPGCVPGAHAGCYDFEGDHPLAALVQEIDPLGNAAISTDRAVSGTHSLRVELPRHAADDTAAHLVQIYNTLPPRLGPQRRRGLRLPRAARLERRRRQFRHLRLRRRVGKQRPHRGLHLARSREYPARQRRRGRLFE